MTRLVWLERSYPSDVDLAVVYPRGGVAEAWDGLVSISENPVTIHQLIRYREGHAYQDHRAGRDFSLSISCFACPEAILRPKTTFGLTYCAQSPDGPELHLVYNAFAQPTDSVFDEDDETPFELKVTTTPEVMPGGLQPSAHLIVNLERSSFVVLTLLAAILYGNDTTDARLPSPDEVFSLFTSDL